MPLFNISDLIWDENIYPRSARKQPTIDAYSEALTARAQFPPIIIQPVVNYPAPNTPLSEILMLILDGIHRWSACKVLGLTEIEAVLWQEQPLDYAACKDDMLLESARPDTSPAGGPHPVLFHGPRGPGVGPHGRHQHGKQTARSRPDTAVVNPIQGKQNEHTDVSGGCVHIHYFFRQSGRCLPAGHMA
jgi:hypothetical protein